ncbi:MAG TPA: hypothetical protein VGI78_24070 [Acetobacteraceae bacterium]
MSGSRTGYGPRSITLSVREVIHHKRSGSELSSRVINIGGIVLDPPGITIDVADIYPVTE